MAASAVTPQQIVWIRVKQTLYEIPFRLGISQHRVSSSSLKTLSRFSQRLSTWPIACIAAAQRSAGCLAMPNCPSVGSLSVPVYLWVWNCKYLTVHQLRSATQKAKRDSHGRSRPDRGRQLLGNVWSCTESRVVSSHCLSLAFTVGCFVTDLLTQLLALQFMVYYVQISGIFTAKENCIFIIIISI